MPSPVRASLVAAAVLTLATAGASAQDRQVYRYVGPDGRVVYSDLPPPADAKNVQHKRVGGNYIETSEPSLAMRQATERFPVTLYTFPCGDPCQSAEALLNARGVPFTKVNIEEPDGQKALKNLTGELSAPVLQVGDKLVAKGFNEARWQAMLADASYPKTPQRRTTRPIEPPPLAKAEPAGEGTPGVTVLQPAPTGYPKQ